MKALTVLTVMCAVVILIIAAQAGQTTATAQANIPHYRQHCSDARNGIRFYRSVTWDSQDELRQHRFTTRWPERWVAGCAYVRYLAHLWQGRAAARTSMLHAFEIDARKAICYVFGSYCKQALSVSWCESRWSPRAANGQFLGIMQMGSSERRKYGHSAHALGQAFAAYAYFKDSGRDWSPWSCKPS